MMDRKTLDIIEPGKHIFYWLIVIIFLLIFDPVPGGIYARIFAFMTVILSYMFVYYSIALFVLPMFFLGKIYLISMYIIVCIIFDIFHYFIYYHLILILDGQSYFLGRPFYEQIAYSTVLFLILGFCAFVLFINKLTVYKLKAENEKERKMLSKELNHLKDNFNSHLTFNFLNYCYQKVYPFSEAAAEKIETYADILRDSFSPRSIDVIPLTKELENIKRYLSFQTGIDSNIHVRMKENVAYREINVVSHLLILLVEYSFKYGDLTNPKHPLVIEFDVGLTSINFVVQFQINSSYKRIHAEKDFRNICQIFNTFYPRKNKINDEFNGRIYSTIIRLNT